MEEFVFVSYASSEESKAREICSDLASMGVRYWLAADHLTPGEKWPPTIIAAIRDCSLFLLVSSSKADLSKFVLRETELADQYGKRIVPIRIEKYHSVNLALFLGTQQSVDYDKDHGREQLRRAVAPLVMVRHEAGPTTQPKPSPPTSTPPKPRAVPATNAKSTTSDKDAIDGCLSGCFYLALFIGLIWFLSAHFDLTKAIRFTFYDWHATQMAKQQKWAEAAEAAENALSQSPEKLTLLDLIKINNTTSLTRLAADIYQQRLFRFDRAYELYNRLAAAGHADPNALVESSLTTAHFDACAQLASAQLADAPSTGNKIHLLAIRFACLSAAKKKEETMACGLELRAAINEDGPPNFASVEHFVGSNPAFGEKAADWIRLFRSLEGSSIGESAKRSAALTALGVTDPPDTKQDSQDCDPIDVIIGHTLTTATKTGAEYGIGCSYLVQPKGLLVAQIVAASPADSAGLRKDDIIIAVDGRSITGLSTNEVTALIRGPYGTKVSLRVIRGLNVITFHCVRTYLISEASGPYSPGKRK